MLLQCELGKWLVVSAWRIHVGGKALILERTAHSFLLYGAPGAVLQRNIWLYAFYAGLFQQLLSIPTIHHPPSRGQARFHQYSGQGYEQHQNKIWIAYKKGTSGCMLFMPVWWRASLRNAAAGWLSSFPSDGAGGTRIWTTSKQDMDCI